jgi:hypothetical protein
MADKGWQNLSEQEQGGFKRGRKKASSKHADEDEEFGKKDDADKKKPRRVNRGKRSIGDRFDGSDEKVTKSQPTVKKPNIDKIPITIHSKKEEPILSAEGEESQKVIEEKPVEENEADEADEVDLDREWGEEEEKRADARNKKSGEVVEGITVPIDDGYKRPEYELTENPEVVAIGGKDGFEEKTEISTEDAEIRELGEKLDSSRRAYIIKNNQMNEKSSLLKKVLGIGKGPQLKEFNDEFEKAKAEYENSLKDYKDAIVKSEVADAGDAEIVAQFLTKGEYLNMELARDEIRVESATWPSKLKGGYLKMLNGYRDLPLKKKLVIGGALVGVGALSGAWAGAAGALAVMSARRAFSMSVGALGYSRMIEGITEKRMASQGETQAQSISTESMNENGEVNMEKLNELLNGKINGINQEIQKRDLAKKWRTYGAIGAGVATSFFGSYIGHQIAESETMKTTIDFWKPKIEHLFGAAIINHSNIPIGGSTHEVFGETTKAVDHSDIPTGASNSKMFEGAVKVEDANAINAIANEQSVVGYQGGKSVWQEAQRQISVKLKEQFETLGANNPKAMEALKIYNIDKLKDVIVADPEKYGLPKGIDFNKMSAKQIADINWEKAFPDAFPSGDITEKLTDSQVENIIENNGGLHSAEHHVAEATTQESEKVAEAVVNNAVEQGFVDDASVYEKFIDQTRDVVKDLASRSKDIYHDYPSLRDVADFDAEIAKMSSLGVLEEDKMKALSALRELRDSFKNIYWKTGMSLFDSGVGVDQAILDMPAKEYIAEHKQDKLVKIFKALTSKMTPEQIKSVGLEPKGNEQVSVWIKRIINAILKKL